MAGCRLVSKDKNNVANKEPATEAISESDLASNKADFPHWLQILYPPGSTYYDPEQKLTAFKSINDSLAYCTLAQMDGVCTIQLLISFYNKTKIDSLEIGHSCDHDQSYPSYTWKEFSIDQENTIITTEYNESVHDSLVGIDGWIKENYDFSEAATKIDSTRQVFKIDKTGLIFEIKISNQQ
jgi:hypothetical protein